MKLFRNLLFLVTIVGVTACGATNSIKNAVKIQDTQVDNFDYQRLKTEKGQDEFWKIATHNTKRFYCTSNIQEGIETVENRFEDTPWTEIPGGNRKRTLATYKSAFSGLNEQPDFVKTVEREDGVELVFISFPEETQIERKEGFDAIVNHAESYSTVLYIKNGNLLGYKSAHKSTTKGSSDIEVLFDGWAMPWDVSSSANITCDADDDVDFDL